MNDIYKEKDILEKIQSESEFYIDYFNIAINKIKICLEKVNNNEIIIPMLYIDNENIFCDYYCDYMKRSEVKRYYKKKFNKDIPFILENSYQIEHDNFIERINCFYCLFKKYCDITSDKFVSFLVNHGVCKCGTPIHDILPIYLIYQANNKNDNKNVKIEDIKCCKCISNDILEIQIKEILNTSKDKVKDILKLYRHVNYDYLTEYEL